MTPTHGSSNATDAIIYLLQHQPECAHSEKTQWREAGGARGVGAGMIPAASATTRCITIQPKLHPTIFNIEIQMKRGEKNIISRNEINKPDCRMKYNRRASWHGQNII